ncbi:MAG: hypothetical protein WKF89_20535 [Chitinophagaceae bacterium]
MKQLSTPFLFWFASVIGIFSVTSCQKSTDPPPAKDPVKIVILNPSFEQNLDAWKIETAYTGRYGFSSDTIARNTGRFGLNFYASQVGHFTNAPQETPWNGKIYQTITGLKDGTYILRAYADATGTGMYLWANGGTADAKILIKSRNSEINTLEFVVQGGTAKFGFACIDAGGDVTILAPYFHADDVELLLK